jgi:dimethylhistidine N-methyltransferase
MTHAEADLPLLDYAPQADDLRGEVLAGLRCSQKQLPAKFFYDARGSELFDQICSLDEYYLTRTELAIMRNNVDAMAEAVGKNALLVEFGSGSSRKTRLLLAALDNPAGYVPIDISRSHLIDSAQALAHEFAGLPILPVCADYHQPFELPSPPRSAQRTVAYFPGSTIGNLHHEDARTLLNRIASLVGPGGGLLIGVDLKKAPDILIPAYSDAEGVTAAFNYNLLHRINREAPADFDVSRFRHEARWNEQHGRMESHLVASEAQTVTVAGQTIAFEAGESIWTECSYKYTLEQFAELADAFHVSRVWTDPDSYFSVQYLEVAER